MVIFIPCTQKLVRICFCLSWKWCGFFLFEVHVVLGGVQQRYVTADNRYMICYFKLNEGAKLPEGEVRY